MANWQRHLNVADVWASDNVKLVARIAAERLAAMQPFDDYPFIEDERLAIVKALNEVAEASNPSVEWFDDVWRRLYDWADTSFDRDYNDINAKKVCWVSTQEWRAN